MLFHSSEDAINGKQNARYYEFLHFGCASYSEINQTAEIRNIQCSLIYRYSVSGIEPIPINDTKKSSIGLPYCPEYSEHVP